MAVEHRHQTLLASKALVNEKVLFIMPHWIAEINVLNLPAVNAADIAGRLIGILESTDIVFMGHNLSEEIPELAASHRK